MRMLPRGYSSRLERRNKNNSRPRYGMPGMAVLLAQGTPYLHARAVEMQIIRCFVKSFAGSRMFAFSPGVSFV